MNKTVQELITALQWAENALRHAHQETQGRVKQEIRGGWLHHAEQARRAIQSAKQEIEQ